jgi:hypothetical protein
MIPYQKIFKRRKKMNLYEALSVADEALMDRYWALDPNKDHEEIKEIEEARKKMVLLRELISSED